jgi:6-pyruvoyltetrahydropterin/6-carboxytetrahydropterin synthase
VSARRAIVELHNDELKFSSGHFMLFSSHERENMHGHDYLVNVAFNTWIVKNGMSFDLRNYRQTVYDLCRLLDYQFILPSLSDYLRIEDQGTKWQVHVGDDALSFLKRDAIVLPITNVTLEELSNWFLLQLKNNKLQLQEDKIFGITVRISNGRGQSASTEWLSSLANTAETEFQSELVLSE